MLEINGNRGTGNIGGAGNHALYNLSFSYRSLASRPHTFFLPQRNINKLFKVDIKRLHENIRDLKEPRHGAIVPYKDGNSTLYFNISEIKGQNVELQLDHIEHKARFGLHLRPKMTISLMGERVNNAGLKVEFQLPEAPEWTQYELRSPLDVGQILILDGDIYRFRMIGENKEERQKALLDLWLALKAEEEVDLKDQAEKRLRSRPIAPPIIYEPNMFGIARQDDSKVKTYESNLSHINASKTGGYYGKIVKWSFYKNFDKLYSANILKIRVDDINAILSRLITEYQEKADAEPDAFRKDGWLKFIELFRQFNEKLLLPLTEGKSEIETASLDKFFNDLIKNKDEKDKENHEMIVNYIVKGKLGEKMDNTLGNTNEPIILCAPSLTVKEAETMANNVKCFLATNMKEGTHPYEILRAKGINTFSVSGGVADFISGINEGSAEDRTGTAVVGGGKLWLNVGLPSNIYLNGLRTQNLSEEEDIRFLAFNGLPRRMIGGKKDIKVRATIRVLEDGTKVEYKMRQPDGIGLFTAEMSHIQAGRVLNEEEMYDKMNELCEMANYVTVRLEDISAKGRRDYKPINGIENKQQLSGAAFLLCEEGREKLLKPEIRAILKAHLKWSKQDREVRIMIPYVVNSGQIVEIRKVLKECKEEIINEVKGSGISETEIKILRDSMRIPLGTMLETRGIFSEGAVNGSYNCEMSAKITDFGSLGLNDLRYAYEKTSLFDPVMIKLIYEAVQQFNKASNHLSVCGQINSSREAMLLLILGIEDFSVNFNQIRGISDNIRSYKKEFLDAKKAEILQATSQEEVERILGDLEKNILVSLQDQAMNAAQEGNRFRAEAEELRLSRYYKKKINVLYNTDQIIRDSAQSKEDRILGVLRKEFGDDELMDLPDRLDIARWIDDEMQIKSFLDEWAIRKFLDKKCRCTPYIFYRSKDGEIWGRAIPRGGDTGSMSRYFIEEAAKSKAKGKKDVIVKMNYLCPKKREIVSTNCMLKPIEGKKDEFDAVINVEGKEDERICVLARQEGGKTVYYRKLIAEKLYVAKILMENESIPADPSIFKAIYEGINAVNIRSRRGLSQCDDELVKKLKVHTSIERDVQNVYYQPDPDNIILDMIDKVTYIKMRDINESQSYVIMVDNWLESKNEEHSPLLKGKKQLEELVRFLGLENKENELFLKQNATINELQMELLLHKQFIDKQKEFMAHYKTQERKLNKNKGK